MEFLYRRGPGPAICSEGGSGDLSESCIVSDRPTVFTEVEWHRSIKIAWFPTKVFTYTHTKLGGLFYCSSQTHV